MKKLHVINVKSLEDVKIAKKQKLFDILEKETLSWAEKIQKDAYKATLSVQKEFKKNPGEIEKKYFKYLRRLLELKLLNLEKEAYKKNIDAPSINKDLVKTMDIEALRIPEYLSCSQLQMYNFCPRKWFWRYAKGIKFPKTAALHFGSSVDEALNFYFEKKIKNQRATYDEVFKVFYQTFDKDSDDVNWGEDDPKKLRKNGPIIIEKYLEQFDRITNPTGVQTEVRIPLRDGDGYLLGFIDILEEEAVVDTKTAKKKWADTGQFAKHKEELQPKAYSLWFLEEFERMPKEFRYQIVTKKTDKQGNAIPEHQLISFQLKKYELEAFRREVQKVWDDIKERLPKGKDAFPAQAEVGNKLGRGIGRKEPEPLCCSAYCDYSEICKEDGLRVPRAWIKKTKDTPAHHVYDD